MNLQLIKTTAKRMVADGKGILAIDESILTCNKRFEKVNIAPTEENRRAYRELLITTPDLNKFISGLILCDETIKQKNRNNKAFIDIINEAGMLAGIKVDAGTSEFANFPGEKITSGLDNLREHLHQYYKIGARFAKWRAVIVISNDLPTQNCIDANAHALARYAALCQEANLVPIVEPEILIDGDHSIDRCYAATEKVLHTVFNQLYAYKVVFDGMILKPNMVLPGLKAKKQSTTEKIADLTVACLLKTVPASVAGVAFLSGGQSSILASERLNTMNIKFKNKLPWPLTFSFARAIQQPALDIWQNKAANIATAQHAIHKRAKCNSYACRGEYNSALENN